MKLLVHGDSNTSTDYCPAAQNWPEQVRVGLGFSSVVNLAVSGRYAFQVRADVSAMIAHQPDLCVIMVGTNDMAAAVANDVADSVTLNAYLADMAAIIDGLQAGGITVAIIAPPFSQYAREAVRFMGWIPALRTLCLSRGVAFVDAWGAMVERSSRVTASAFASLFNTPGVDGWHLSIAGRGMLAELVLQQLGAAKAPPVQPPPPAESPTSPIGFLAQASQVADAAVYTFPGIPLGTPSANRSIIVSVGSRANALRSLQSITIGGVPAAVDIQRCASGAASTDVVAICRAAVPSGTVGDIVVTFSEPMLRCAIAVHALDHLVLGAVQSASAGSGGSPVSLVINVTSGVIAAGWFNSNNGIGSLTGVTADGTQTPETTSNTLIVGHAWLTSAQTNRSISLGSSTNFNAAALLVAAAYTEQ